MDLLRWNGFDAGIRRHWSKFLPRWPPSSAPNILGAKLFKKIPLTLALEYMGVGEGVEFEKLACATNHEIYWIKERSSWAALAWYKFIPDGGTPPSYDSRERLPLQRGGCRNIVLQTLFLMALLKRTKTVHYQTTSVKLAKNVGQI